MYDFLNASFFEAKLFTHIVQTRHAAHLLCVVPPINCGGSVLFYVFGIDYFVPFLVL